MFEAKPSGKVISRMSELLRAAWGNLSTPLKRKLAVLVDDHPSRRRIDRFS